MRFGGLQGRTARHIMGIMLTGPKRSVTMRSSFYRALLAALCVLLVLMAMLRKESISVRSELWGKAGVKANTVHEQKPLEDPSLPPSVPGDYKTGVSNNFNLNCSVDMPHLQKIREKYSINERFQYMKRYIRFTRVEGLERKRMTKISQNLLNGAFKTIDVNKHYGQDACEKPLEVQVPASGLPSSVNASDFMFGVSTTFKRFMACDYASCLQVAPRFPGFPHAASQFYSLLTRICCNIRR